MTPSFEHQIVRPNYGKGCFADLPRLLQGWLTEDVAPEGFAGLDHSLLRRYDAVILVLADAFGWNLFERFADQSPFLQRIVRDGVVARWTSQFPSTTAAHITCIHTGLPPVQSGIFEWQYYEPTVDELITPLLFSHAGVKGRDTLKLTNARTQDLYPGTTLHFQLREQGVQPFVFQHREYTPSTYTDWVCRGAKVRPYLTLPEGLYNLRQELGRVKKPAYVYLYFDKIDTIGHFYGPDSPQSDLEVETFLFCLERALMQPLLGKQQNTLLVVAADHGQIQVNPQETIYLNLDPRYAQLQHYLRTNSKGEFLIPGGSARDLFLYIKDEDLDEAHQFLTDWLGEQAAVWKVTDMIEQGFFGLLKPSAKFRARVGNLVILPHANKTVWIYQKDKYEMKFFGKHGGLSAAEMEIPLLFYQF